MKKKFKSYATTRIKSRNLLSNISYPAVSDQHVIDRNFVFDIYVLMVKNLNPFSLERKLTDQSKHEMLYMLWKDCMTNDFYKFICKKENFSYLNGKNALYPKVSNIVWSFIAENENNYKKLRKNLRKNKSIFQYVYSIVYPEIYCSTEKRGFDLKSEYLVAFKEYKDKKRRTW